MTSPSSASTRLGGNESDWQYAARAPKRRKRASTGVSRPSPREIGFMREPRSDGSASFIGSSSGIHFIRHVYDAFARRSADLQESRARDKSSVPGEDDRLHQTSGNTNDRDELWSKGELDFAPHASFSFGDLVAWTRPYFENWHPIFPCLHAPTVLKTLDIISHTGIESISQSDLIVIRSIISISLADSRQAPAWKIGPVPATLVFQTAQHVMQDTQSLLIDATTLPLLQAAFVAQLTLTSLLRLNAASRIGGVITRTGFHLGLHRCPGRFSCFSSDEMSIRRRLFWSVYCLERYLSQALGIPLSIRDDDIDVCYPGAERHATTGNTEVNDDQRLRLLAHLAKFARIRGLILELRNKSILHSHAGTVEASHVNGELSQWWNEIYDDVNPMEDHEDSILSSYHRLLLTILRHEAIISMNRPLLATEKPSPEYKNALQTCIESSRALLGALKKYIPSSDVPLAWPSFTWTTWMACLILMFASWEGNLPVLTALKYAKMGTSVLENLSLRGSSWPETCIEAIRSMESALTSNSCGRQGNRESIADGRSARNLQPDLGETDGRFQTQHSDQCADTRVPLAQSDNQDVTIGGPHLIGRPSSSALRVHPDGLYDSAATPPHDSYPDTAENTPNDNLFLNGQTSGELIFGNMAGSTGTFPGIAGQDILPFSDTLPLAMTDWWSVADGPWMIDGNFL